jgi:ABC-type bacteriocin/lantibiotic exporter with double-glycine peptidase domain
VWFLLNECVFSTCSDTIRNNILFGKKFEEQRYLDVVHVCALVPDLLSLSAGDQTAIGEKGTNLSGGQKARIQLSRSVYSDSGMWFFI